MIILLQLGVFITLLIAIIGLVFAFLGCLAGQDRGVYIAFVLWLLDALLFDMEPFFVKKGWIEADAPAPAHVHKTL